MVVIQHFIAAQTLKHRFEVDQENLVRAGEDLSATPLPHNHCLS